ncbi:lysophospholipid acyltransferase family protein [Catenulispora yoronensis]|uniref:Lysophospholipid acyltransferase family protein n=1 Tax=Catenulispora yoronensis TaxID=450799 RepID=A0ABP5F418_9ACTN
MSHDEGDSGPESRMRAAGRRLLGICLLIFVSAIVVPVAVVAGLYTVLTTPLRLRVGRYRRVLAVAVIYAALEITGLAVAAWRWIRFHVDHDAVRDRDERRRSLTTALNGLRRAARRYGGLDVLLVAPSSDQRSAPPEMPPGPLIVCGRHGGVGGAFLLAHLLLAEYGRLPRVVLKDTLAWDPLIDALLSRIPHAFIDPQPGDHGATAARVGELAQGMAADDALLIFPEGGNFTPRRRLRAIRRLRRRGLGAAAARAEQLHNVMPPHPDGVFAAIESSPRAAVVFVAHTGLDHLQSASDVWRALPLREPVVYTWWAVPATEIPQQPETRMGWLEDNWARIDGWVARNQVAL